MTASVCIQWIREELEAHDDLKTLQPPLVNTDSLCEFVTDGRALCLLANVLLPNEANEVPKKLKRSLPQLSKFHALERVQFFIKWCRTRAKLEEHQVFTTVQLLDEVNEMAVSETIIALRRKTRPDLTNAIDPYCVNARTSTNSSTSTDSSNANRLSSFLNKFPSVPVVATATSQSKPPTSHNRVSLTSSVASSNPSPREFDEPVPVHEVNNSNSTKSRLRIPSIFKGNNNAALASATSRSSVISTASSTASSNKEEGHETCSRSWSSKLSAFSRHSSSSNASAPKPPSADDLDSSDTPSSSPVASPHNRVSIPCVFSTPSPAAPKSMSKLSAFLSSVDTTLPVTPASPTPSTPSFDKKTSDVGLEATSKEDPIPAIEVNQAEEEPHVANAEEIPPEIESTNMNVETENKPLKEPVLSAKLLAFLQAVEPGSTTLPKQEVSVKEEDEDGFVAVEVDELMSAEKDAFAVEEEVAPVEDEVVESESEGSDVEVEHASSPEEEEPTEEEMAPEMHDEVAMKTPETSEEEVEEAPEDETPERQEVAPVAQLALVSSEMLQENERLLVENDALTQKLETAETAVAKKDSELDFLKQEVERLNFQLAEEQTRVHDKLQVAEKKHEVFAAGAAEARAELAKLQQTLSKPAFSAKEAKAQMEELAAQNKSLTADLTNLREEVQTLEQSVQLARDSEEAARYAAQVAFAARDAADEVNQQLKDQLAQLGK